MTTFDDLGLSEDLLKAIKECGYDTPTPIQAQAIPHVLMARDVVGLAQTGTGKTAGFTLPMIEILAGGRAKARMPRSLILSPTRELAGQIAENFETYGKYINLNMALLTGGTSMGDQIKKLDKGVDVLIATPGRLLDLFERGQILLNDIKILVIDEADRMMDMGFIPDIEKIVKMVPFTRQTLLFSATMPPEIKKLAEKFLSNPREVAVSAPASTAKNVEQFLVYTTSREKKTLLGDLIKSEKVSNAFIFCNRKRDIDGVMQYLQGKGYNAEAMHGDLAQSHRTKVLQKVKDGQVDLLVCSDVAGRGIDVDDLGHVFNYDIPMNADDYVHRIGRTGRAGKSGRAWTLVTSHDAELIEKVEKKIKKSIEVVDFKGSGGGSKSDGGLGRSDRPCGSKGSGKSEPRHKKEQSSRVKPQRNERGSSKARSKPKSRDDDQDSGATGFGDDIPGFLMRK